MNKYLGQFLDHALLDVLHQKRSLNNQFSNTWERPPMEHLTTFYEQPAIPDMTFEKEGEEDYYQIGKFAYNSEVQSEHEINNISVGTFYENLLNTQDVHVIFVHGWRMNRLDRIKELFLDRFMDIGYHMYFFTMPYHLERTPKESLYGGEFLVSANIERTLLAIKQAVTDIRALIAWIRTHRGGKIVLIGMSLGGFLTNLVSVLEDQVDVLVSVFYANSIAYSVWNTIPGKFIKMDFEQHGFTYELLKQYWAITEPSRFQPKVGKDHILLQSGQFDQFVLQEDADHLWEAWGKPRKINYACGHAGLGVYKRRIAEDVVQFLKPRLRE